MIGIIDYGMGNLRSVQKALESVGAQAQILASPAQSASLSHLVLPGVGAFGDGMQHLRERGWIEFIFDFIASNKPFLGICLGMQLLFTVGEEDAPSPDDPIAGLNILPGRVVAFRGDAFGAGKLKVPQMGWNTLTWNRNDPLLAGLEQNVSVYFVHGYHAVPDANLAGDIISATTDYGSPICASVWHNNIWATQFHPEKSQRVGLAMLRNFASLR